MHDCHFCMESLEEGQAICPTSGRKTATATPAHYLRPGTVLNRKYLTLGLKLAIEEYYPKYYVN